MTCTSRRMPQGRFNVNPWEKNCHRELTVTTVVTAPGPMITAQSRLGEVTAQSRQGHSSVTAQSQHLQYDHGSVTARSQLNHGPGHGSVTAGCDHFGHRELTVSSHGGQFFLMGSQHRFKTSGNTCITWAKIDRYLCHCMGSLGHNEFTEKENFSLEVIEIV